MVKNQQKMEKKQKKKREKNIKKKSKNYQNTQRQSNQNKNIHYILVCNVRSSNAQNSIEHLERKKLRSNKEYCIIVEYGWIYSHLAERKLTRSIRTEYISLFCVYVDNLKMFAVVSYYIKKICTQFYVLLAEATQYFL